MILTNFCLYKSDIFNTIYETNSYLQRLEIDINGVNICCHNLDYLLYDLPVIRQLHTHICTGTIYTKFFGLYILAAQAISSFWELALDCFFSCSPPKHINWVDESKVVILISIWDRRNKWEVRWHRLCFCKNPKKLWNFTDFS